MKMRPEFAKYQLAVVEDYHQKVKESRIAQNLVHLKTTQVRQECLDVFDRRYLESEEDVLRMFFGQQKGKNEYRVVIENFDVDKFRQIGALVRGEIAKTDQKNVELLAWLIDFQLRPCTRWVNEKPERGKELEGRTRKLSKTATISIIISITFAAIFVVTLLIKPVGPLPPKPSRTTTNKSQCMYWNNDHYESVECGQSRNGALIVQLDTQKLAHLKKVTDTSKVTADDIGHIWYRKVNGRLELFTAAGPYPPDTTRRLLPLTAYMYHKYLHHKVPAD